MAITDTKSVLGLFPPFLFRFFMTPPMDTFKQFFDFMRTTDSMNLPLRLGWF